MEDQWHAPDPKAGSFRRADGREADLFTASHYPVEAVCRVCGGIIRARSFMLPFEHETAGDGARCGHPAT